MILVLQFLLLTLLLFLFTAKMSDVNVTFVFEEKAHFGGMHSRSSSWRDVCAIWEAMRDTHEEFRYNLEYPDGPAIAGGIISDLVPQKFAIEVHVMKRDVYSIYIFGAPRVKISTCADSQTTPQALICSLRKELGIDDDRKCRLWNDKRILKDNKTLGDQMDKSTRVYVDFEVNFKIYEKAAANFEAVLYLDDEEEVPLVEAMLGNDEINDECAVPAFPKKTDYCWERRSFVTESGMNLLDEAQSCQREVRFLREKMEISLEESLTFLLREGEIIQNHFSALVMAERELFICVNDRINGRVYSCAIWPSFTLNELAPSDCSLVVGEDVISPNQTARDAGLQDGHTITITKFETVLVETTNGSVHKLYVDLGQTLNDFYQRISELEGDNHFNLYLNKKKLPRGTGLLIDNGVHFESTVTVKPKLRTVLLCVKGDTSSPLVPLSVRQGTSIEQLIELSSKSLRVYVPRGTRFLCQCGREISEENEYRREFAYRCCSQPEPELFVILPEEQHSSSPETQAHPETRDAATQSVPRNTKGKIRRHQSASQSPSLALNSETLTPAHINLGMTPNSVFLFQTRALSPNLHGAQVPLFNLALPNPPVSSFFAFS
jgi:hypothetical protein